MELRLKDGKYDSIGARLCTVSGAEELAQRVMMKLAARRGSFWPLPDYGSRLYRLVSGERPKDRELAVRQYVAEALSDESGVTLTDVQISYTSDDTMRLRLYFSWSGGSFSTDQIIRS